MFSIADSKVSPVFNLKCYILISLALVADAVIGNVQEKAMKGYKSSNEEIFLEIIIYNQMALLLCEINI